MGFPVAGHAGRAIESCQSRPDGFWLKRNGQIPCIHAIAGIEVQVGLLAQDRQLLLSVIIESAVEVVRMQDAEHSLVCKEVWRGRLNQLTPKRPNAYQKVG